jgi:CrcB protein
MIRYLLIMLGAGLGGALRAFAATAITDRFAGRFPWGTFLVNISGCFGIGLLMTLLTERYHPHPYWRMLLVVGFLGGYTTFSSFEYETFITTRTGSFWIGLANVLASVALGYIAVWLGWLAASKRFW